MCKLSPETFLMLICCDELSLTAFHHLTPYKPENCTCSLKKNKN